MAILDLTGHTRLMWDANSNDEVENARNTFDNLRAKGYLAYTVKEGGDKGEIMSEFDPHASKVIMSPPMRGG